MAFPKDLDELKAQGYVFQDHGVCRGCYADIEWYLTPQGNKIPMDPMDRGTAQAVAHMQTCQNPAAFRKDT